MRDIKIRVSVNEDSHMKVYSADLKSIGCLFGVNKGNTAALRLFAGISFTSAENISLAGNRSIFVIVVLEFVSEIRNSIINEMSKVLNSC